MSGPPSPVRYPLAIALGVLAAVVVGSTAFAHIDPDPTDAQAGSELSVGFTVEHGCDGSPTVQLDMRLPEGTSDPVPEPPPGWIGSVDGEVVTFQGGPLPDDQEMTFRVRMVLPPTPDTTIYFPFVQRCEVGEIRWIDVPTTDDTTDLDEPAPAMQLFGPVATTVPAPTTTAAPPTTPATTSAPTTVAPTTAAPTTAAPTTNPTTTAPATTTPTTPATAPATTAAAPTTTDAASADDDSAETVALVAVLVALGVAATVVVLVRRRRP